MNTAITISLFRTLSSSSSHLSCVSSSYNAASPGSEFALWTHTSKSTVEELANKLKDLNDEAEKRCQTARGMGPMQWAIRRYSSKLLALREDLTSWIEETENVLLQLNRDNSTVLQIDLGGVMKGTFPSRLLLQRQAAKQEVHFNEMPTRVHHSAFKETTSCGRHAIGTIDGYNGLYIAEIKPFASRSHSTGDQASADEDFKQLALLLHNSPLYDKQLAVLSCQLFSKDHQNHVYTLLFALPGADVPNSLSTLLRDSTEMTPLQVRLRLAKQIFNSIGHLHAYAWLHKSLRSSNVHFLESSGASGGALEPKLLGFESSRSTRQASRRLETTNSKDLLYLHPDRWDRTTVSFAAVHDIYGKCCAVDLTVSFDTDISYSRRRYSCRDLPLAGGFLVG
jgi:hypothetical protein